MSDPLSRRAPSTDTGTPGVGPPALQLFLGDVIELRRKHPCGGAEWLVDRLGADIGLRCRTCGRHVLVDRRTVERRLVRFVERGDPAITAVVSGSPAPVKPT